MHGDPGSGEGGCLPPGLSEASEAIRHGSRRQRIRRGLLVSVFTLAALTGAAELFLRITDQRGAFFEASVNKTNQRWVDLTTARLFEEVDDPVLRYAMRPGADAEVEGWRFRVSNHRSRGADFPLEKPANERRLLCLGDSFAFGLWCDEDQTLVGHLTRMANEVEERAGSGVHWRGVDLGVPGYHTEQQVRSFEQFGLALDPDVVVLYFNTNDIEQEGFFFDARLGVLRRDFLPLPSTLRRWLWNSHLYGWIVTKHRNAVEGRATPHLDPDVPYAHVRADNQRATRSSLERLVSLCRRNDVPLYFVNQPLMTWMGDTLKPDWDIVPLVEWAETTRTELGIPGTNLLGWARGFADGVDRSPEPPEFLLDVYFADERAQKAFGYARSRARDDETEWDRLTYPEMLAAFAGYPEEIPREIDFHLTGEGYGHIARIVFPAMQAAGMLP